LNFEFINKHLAFLTIKASNQFFTFKAVHLPYDNNSSLNLSEFLSSLDVIHGLFLFYSFKRHSVFIIGDFNCYITRNNRFDIIFNDFVKNNNLCFISPSSDPNEFSYQNGLYKAKLDHCLVSNDKHGFYMSSFYKHDVINLSDHEPLNS
jgi:hypothetical protein